MVWIICNPDTKLYHNYVPRHRVERVVYIPEKSDIDIVTLVNIVPTRVTLQMG